MTYTLAIGDRAYSSWSLRGWLLFAAFGIPVKTQLLKMKTPAFAEDLAAFAPARLVAALKIEGEGVVWDTLAIAETLHERHPEAGLWPKGAAARAHARSVVAEMHSGFGALRSACPMVLAHGWDFTPSDAVLADLARIEALWESCAAHATEGPWLFGDYSIADAFYAPVAMRIAGFGLPVGDRARAYVEAHLNHMPFRRWRATGLAENRQLEIYALGYPHTPWPGPAPRPAMTVIGAKPINETCPFSSEAVSPDALVKIDDTVVGLCNTFCRNKVAADPEAWPEVMALLP